MSMSSTSVGTSTHGEFECDVTAKLLDLSRFHMELPNLRVPAGFPDLLESFSREVLRAQPEDVVEFACEFFEGLLNKRPGRKGMASIKKKQK